MKIREAIKEKKYALITCLDIEKAFDSVNHETILIKAKNIGLSGKIIRWINNFLCNRTFQIKIGEKKSAVGKILNGVPQGSPISPTLFNLVMSDIKLPKETDKVIYADDITLITSNENLVEAKNNLEQSLNKIKEWAEKWKLKINPTKSKVMCFTNKKLEQNPIIKIGNEELEYTNNHKILGMIFDAPKLTWKKHVEYVKTKSVNRIL